MREVLEKFDFDNTISKLDEAGLLFTVLEEFKTVDLHPDKIDNATMGTIFEELIRKFNEALDENPGEHFTPRDVVHLNLCLLASLLHPEPAPLVAIEEPELGLHPDLLPTVADLLIAASERCQLVVTTHSDVLVDALTDTPESVVVCEKHDGQTEMRRLDKVDLERWLKEYTLGNLWSSGQLGGNRW